MDNQKSNKIALNVAAVCQATRVLGPGLRAVVWVQGCKKRCQDCLAPEWQSQKPQRLMRIEELMHVMLANPAVSGITLSGGEPMLQAMGLTELLYSIREIRDVNVICYSGYTLEELRTAPPAEGINTLLSQLDVLIDGEYVSQLNHNLGLTGSSNQQVHHLTRRLYGADFVFNPRQVEVQIRDGEMLVVGVPPHGFEDALAHALEFV